MVGRPDGIGASEMLRGVAAEVVHPVAVALDKPAGEVFLQVADGLGGLRPMLRVLDVLRLLPDGFLQLFLAVGEAGQELHRDLPADLQRLVVRFQVGICSFTFGDV